MMGSASERNMEEDVPKQPESEAGLDKMAQWVQNLFKFKHFYNWMDFNPGQKLDI